MHKRNLYLILILILVILSASFVSASENVSAEVKDDIVSSVSDEIVIDENNFVENIGKDSNEDSSSTDFINESQITNETEKIDKVQVLRAGNDEIQISSVDNNQILGVGTAYIDDYTFDNGGNAQQAIYGSVDDNQILQAGTPYIDNSTFENGGTAQQVIERILQLSDYYGSEGAVLYLNGKNYTGRGELKAGDSQIIEIKNVKVIGGTRDDPTKMATFTCADYWASSGIALNFRGSSSDWGTKFYSNSGYSLTNVSFYYINSEDKFLRFAGGGTLTDCVVDHCQSVKQFINLIGSPDQYDRWGRLVAPKNAIQLNNCNFTYCAQTYGFNPDPGYDDYYDDNGHFAEVFGAVFNNCNFINTTSGQHGGALCIADESEWGPGTVTSTVYNTNFINVTSRWFAIYIHGKFRTSPGDLDSPEQIINCTFVNCVGTGEYSGGIGISRSDLLIENCNFTNCSGGQGAAIMVGGIDKDHDGFNGDNNEVNNVKIFNCTFTNNIASTDKGYTYCTGYVQYSGSKDSSTAYYKRENGGYVFSGYGTQSAADAIWYVKHNPKNYTASGNAGAIYVIGDGTYIKDCIFNENKAEKGAAIYIEGNNTKVENTKFYNQHSKRGTIFIEGNNTLILNSTFIDNVATYGAGVYIDGNNTNITNSNFEINNADYGAGVYIEGKNTLIYDSNFTENEANEGAGIYVNGDDTVISCSTFEDNYAYVNGGAIFVRGDNTLTDNNDYEHNKARNGSAIYSSGNNLTIINDIFRENQAWSYLLTTVAEPDVSFYNTNDVKIEVVHIGGDNMLNAIHNNASNDQIKLKNVTYVNNYGNEMRTKEFEFEYPEDGVENSEKGTKLYQDDREYCQLLYINVTDEDGNVIYNNTNITTNLYGEVYFTLHKSKLRAGRYTVNVEHPEDWNYKGIKNHASFTILDYVDVSIEKTSDKVEYFDDDIAIWTIKVKNAANGTNATNVVVDDILPSGFEFINYTTANGTYNNHTGIWTIGFMGNGTEAILVIYALVESDIERLDHIVHIDCEEKNVDISIDRIVNPIEDNYNEGDLATWTITVTNKGNHLVHDVVLIHSFPFEFELEPNTVPYASQGTYDDHNHVWDIGDMASGQVSTINIISRAIVNVTQITNLMVLDYKEKHLNLTVDKTSDKEEYLDGEEATITIIVHNGDGCEATNLFLKDILQPEFEYNSHMGSGYNQDTDVWTIGDMAQNSQAKLVIKTTARKVYGDVTNIAVVTSQEADWDETNNEADRTVRIVPLPEPMKTVSNITPNYYDEVEYNLTINNTGNFPYEKNLTVIDSLPDELEYIGLVNLIGAKPLGFKQEGNKLIWNITSIDPGVPAIITIKVRVIGLGDLITNKTFIDNVTGRNDIAYIGNLTNNLTVIGPNGTEKIVSSTVYPVPITDLSVDIVSDKDEYFVDDIAVWTITVHNAGNGTNATNVNLTEVLPDAFFDIISCTTENGTYYSNNGTWNIGFMGNGTDAVLVITGHAKNLGKDIPNSVSVISTETDWDLGNNDGENFVDIVERLDSNLTVDNVVLDYGETANVTVLTNGAIGITAKIDGKDAIVTGYSILIPVLDAGNHILSVSTIADANHNNVTKNVTVTVNKLKTKLSASAVTTIYNINRDLVITLKDSNGNALIGVEVTVKLNGAKKYTTDKNGQVKVQTKALAPKKYTVKVTFNGNTNYIKSLKDVKVTVKKAKPKMTAKKKTFKATKKVKKYTITLKDNTGKAIKKAKVTLKVKSKTYKAKTNSKGKATFKIKKLNKKGTYKVVVKYNGNKYYTKATKKVKITVKK